MTLNRAAFLALTRHSEGTDLCHNPWAATFGCNVTGYFITNFNDHPACLGWKGYPLNSLGARYEGERSTAAGAYQLILPTWVTLKSRLHLPDFSAASQDACALELLRECGALDLIDEGRVVEAIEKCHGIWASFPGSNSGQPQAKMTDLVKSYTDNGGGFV